MPDRPLWLDRLPLAIQYLTERTESWVDRTALEAALGIGRRRAQQLLSQIPNHRIGANLVAERGDVIAHLELCAAGEAAHYERTRRQRLWSQLETTSPPVLVEIPDSQQRQIETLDLEGLPAGVELTPGAITVRFASPDEALQKLMALALAIGANPAAFEERVKIGRLVNTTCN